MDLSGRSAAPFSTGGAAAGPIVPPPQGIVFGRAAAAGRAGPGAAAAGGVGPNAGQTQRERGRPISQPNPGPGVMQNPATRKPSPVRTRRGPQVVEKPQANHHQQPVGAVLSEAELQREANAKARRLLRFSEGRERETIDSAAQVTSDRFKADDRLQMREARQLSQLRTDPPRTPVSASDNGQEDTMEAEGVGDDFNNNEAITGTCNDMCSETERHERERKGDLDRFERVDGDRNLTSVDMAVKKYTRTPSREPHMIRPLPVLQMTMDHLLGLINRDYDEELLNIHSFLWDRMRAVRMDLRMQHIFNREAITMHEQMIRFHILAMHELCQFKKGEGFNEGFDAHLNIEQMNKASVDLFEMYDDHRKRGIQVDTEPEFRGYYALLKLDKHPGYSVEPAELSLDLAKMTPEMRNTPQVLFARDVARACRGGNYIAFFRLARKATYLQACLMHAHFAKLRTEALASLHSGLQKNQGVPVALVVKWLGMEGEETEALVDYHGFTLKNFEKLYAVKDGPFLNRDADYQTRRSRLVEAKHSLTIVADVEGKGQQQVVADSWAASVMTPVIQEEEMPDYEEDFPSPLASLQTSHANGFWTGTPGSNLGIRQEESDDMRISPPFKAVSPPKVSQTFPFTPVASMKTPPLWPSPVQSSLGLSFPTDSLSPQRGRKRESYPGRLTQDIDLKEGNKKLVTELGPIDVEPEEEDDLTDTGPTEEQIRAQKILEREVEKETEREKERERERRKQATEAAEAAAAQWAAKLAAAAELKRIQEEEERLARYRAEASAGKKRQWLRRWKRRAAILAEEKRRRKIRAEAALSTISVGPPLAGAQVDEGMALVAVENRGSAMMSIDEVARERAEKIQEMWSPLDVASLVLPLFESNYPSSKFITFKLILSVGDIDTSNLAGQWLCSKLQGSQLVPPEVHIDGRTPGFWFQAKDFDNSTKSEQENAVYGASGLVFLVRKGWPISEERARLQSVVESLPIGGRLPLLLFYTPQERQIEAETEKLKKSLGLLDFEGLRIGWQNVSPVSSSFTGALFSDGFLRGGLIWLATTTAPQPNLRPVHVRELVIHNLDGHWKLLTATPPSNVTPERCIIIFNRSVRSAAMEIRKAVSTAPPHWPPPEAQPEVSILLPGVLPQQGWNESDILDPILHALKLAELPRFPAMEQLKPSSPTSLWESVRYQKAAVERALRRYLSILDGTNEDNSVTVRQAQLMVQRNCTLEWTESGQVLVPRWANIFQGIYQTRLLLLNSEPPPTVFILSKGDEDVERQLELDEVEQKIPFAKDIAAGNSFGMTRHVKLKLDDMVLTDVRPTLQEKLSLAKSYNDRFLSDDGGSVTPLGGKQLPSPYTKRVVTPSPMHETWSIFSPSSVPLQQNAQPVSLKKRRLALSPESAIQSPPANFSHSSPTVWEQPTSVSELQMSQSNEKTQPLRQRFEISRIAEEIELDNILSKANEDAERVVRRASSDMCFADTRFAADLFSDGTANGEHFATETEELQGMGGNRRMARGQVMLSPVWNASGGMQDLDHLLERCWKAQKSIDNHLRDMLGVEGFRRESF